MNKKYYVCRFHTCDGKKTREYKRTKCLDSWVSETYFNEHPADVWQFSKQGAQKIVDRYNAKNFMTTYGEYHILQVK